MGNNQSVNGLPVPVEVFNPRPELALQPRIMVRAGVFIASTAVVAALNPRPEAGLFGTEYGGMYTYGLYMALLLLFLFGMWLIILGWVAADHPEDNYDAVTRNAIRATQLVLVLAIGLYEFYAN